MTSELSIRRLAPDADADADAVAAMIAATDPWRRFGRDFATMRALVTDSARETYVATVGERLVGAVVLALRGPLNGYVQILCVAEAERGRGLGSRLLAFAEERIFQQSPNVFLCVSSFNDRARALYERLGYRKVGELEDMMIAGASELLFRKTRGPVADYRPG